jgi:hypothetical protein
MVSDLLRDFQLAAVRQVRDAGRAEGMVANPRFDAGRFDGWENPFFYALGTDVRGRCLVSCSNRRRSAVHRCS